MRQEVRLFIFFRILTKFFSSVSDCLHLQLYRDSRDRYKQGQTKASLSLQQFLGVESGFTLDKESNTIAILCQDVTVVLAFDTRERLIQWQVKISCNLGEDQQFLVLVSQAPSKAKISTGPARLHVQELRFCMTSGVPPRLLGFWEIGHLRRYGVIEGRFCFEGGSRCGKGEGLYVLVTDQGQEITKTLQLAAQGKLASRRRQVVRKSSAMESPRKFLHSRQENRLSEGNHDGTGDSILDGEGALQTEQRSGSPFWSVESRPVDLDSNFGCGDTASVHLHADGAWPHQEGRGGPTSLERCVSCISKLGAPSMSRSSTANTSTLFSPAWTMDPVPPCHHQDPSWALGSDRMSVSSHGTNSTGSGNSEYSVPRYSCQESRAAPTPIPPLPPKSPAPQPAKQQPVKCQCCPPSRPPKPAKEPPPAPSPSRKKMKKPPMPLPPEPPCSCRSASEALGPYQNYDVPRNLVVKEVHEKQPDNRSTISPTPSDYYDTPRSIKEGLFAAHGNCGSYANYDTPPPAKTIRKPCGCVVTFARQADSEPRGECPCQRVLCWAENWMLLPYCRRGRGVEHTGVPIHKVKLSGEGKMPVMNPSGEIAVYATIDKGGKANEANYVNVAPESDNTKPELEGTSYENIDFAQSLEHYENAKDLVYKAGISRLELDDLSRDLTSDFSQETEVSYSLSNGVKVCNKCGHACEPHRDKEEPPGEPPQAPKQEDYLMMDPSQAVHLMGNKFPGYLPMFPSNKTEVLKLLASRGLPVEKSASISSLPSCGLRGRRLEPRVPGSAMMVVPSMRRLLDSDEERRNQISSRKRSSSADSSRYLEDTEDHERESSPAAGHTSDKPTSNSLTSLPYQSPKKLDKESLEVTEATVDAVEEECCERTIVEDLAGGGNDEDCSSSGSLQTLVHEGPADTSGSVHIRRSSSVPCKSGTNRDSSSSNDSGVSTGSLKHRGGDFTEFELPLTTSLSARRHQSVAQRHPGITCLHASLPRRSKSSDPLRELSFQFQTTKIPAKSSSAEAEVPICSSKKGYFSPGDGMTVPYMDSRSTSSGTSDMSDYIETLSLSSHSSSDAPDSSLHRMSRIAATTLRPRSGNEYHKIDRSILNGDLVGKNQRAHYANIAPLPEKSESPSPGYMSSSPAHELCNDL